MQVRRRYVAGGAAGAILAGAALVGIAMAGGGDDEPLTGETRDRAIAAALAATGGGDVVEAEAGDGGAAYEVGIRLPDGTYVDVELSSDFTVTGTEVEGGGADEAEAADGEGDDD